VFDPKAPSSERALVELGKPKLRRALVDIAKWSTRSDADADDLVSDAIVAVLDPEGYPWVSLKRTFLTHMSYVMRHIWDEDMRRARVKRELIDEDVTRDKGTVSRVPPVDDELDRLRSLAVLQGLGARLIDEIGDKFPIATKVYELGAAGVEEPAEQAAIIQCSVEEVYEATRTLKHHARRIRGDYDREEERRMRELREQHEKKGPQGES
jgi:hypothetical protein